jgi:hypothetical protein
VSLTAARARSDAQPQTGRRLAVEPATLAVVALTAFAFALRFSQIHQSLLGDEVFTYQDIHGRSFGAVLTTVHTGGENSPPLFFLLAWLTAKLGDATVWIRLPSVVLGAATVPLVYVLGRQTVGRLAGLTGAALFAISPFTVYYGSEARPYATMTFFVALSTVALLRAVETRELPWWTLYVLAAVAAAYTHYTSVFVLVVQGGWSIWRCRDRLRQPLIASAVAAALYLPWLPQLRGKELGVIGGLYPLTAGNVVKDLVRWLVGYVWASLTQIPGTWGLVVIGACLLAGLAAVLARWRRTGSPRPDWAASWLLIVALAVATPVGLLLYSIAATDLWLPRGLSASIPAAMLVIGALLVAVPGRARIVAVGAVLVTLAVGTITSLGPDYVREPYRAMAAYVDQHARPQDRVVVFSFIGQPAIAAMIHRPHPVLSPTGFKYDSVPHGAYLDLFLDDHVAQRLNLRTPHPAGFTLVSHTHYRGSLPTELLVYRRS